MKSNLFNNKKCSWFFRCSLVFGLIFSIFFGMCSALNVQAETGDYTATIYHKHGEACKKLVACGGSMKESVYFTQGCSCGPDHPCASHGCYWEEPNSTYPSGCWHCYCPTGKVFYCSICNTKGVSGSCTVKKNKLVCEKGDCEVARLTVKKSTEEWTNSLQLSAEIEMIDGTLPAEPYIWNGQEPSDCAVFEVPGNGIYTFSMAGDEYCNASEVVISVPVDRLDTTPPTVQLIYDDTPDLPCTVVKVEASDIQPEGTAGCGLAEEPYSFDGGQTWQSEGEIEVDQNGTVNVQVRDMLGNTAEASVTIENLDKEGPDVTLTVSPEVWKSGKAVITAQAQDMGCGLAEEAFAWEGGEFEASNQYSVNKSGTYGVIVRDKNGNETGAFIKVIKLSQPAAAPEESIEGGNDGGSGDGSTDNGGTGSNEDTGNIEDQNPEKNVEEDDHGTDTEQADEKDDPDNIPQKDKVLNVPRQEKNDTSDDIRKKNDLTKQTKTKKVKAKEQPSLSENDLEETEMTETIADSENSSDKNMTPHRESFFETGAGKAAAITVSSALLLIVISLLLYFLYMAARIYNRDTEGKYHYLGSLLIHHGEDQFYIAIPESMEEQSFTKEYEMRPGRFFLLLNHGDEMAIGRKDESPRVSMLIEKNMKFKL